MQTSKEFGSNHLLKWQASVTRLTGKFISLNRIGRGKGFVAAKTELAARIRDAAQVVSR
jgi:hypothetical protein